MRTARDMECAPLAAPKSKERKRGGEKESCKGRESRTTTQPSRVTHPEVDIELVERLVHRCAVLDRALLALPMHEAHVLLEYCPVIR